MSRKPKDRRVYWSVDHQRLLAYEARRVLEEHPDLHGDAQELINYAWLYSFRRQPANRLAGVCCTNSYKTMLLKLRMDTYGSSAHHLKRAMECTFVELDSIPTEFRPDICTDNNRLLDAEQNRLNHEMVQSIMDSITDTTLHRLFEMVYLQGKSKAEAAKLLGMKIQSVRSMMKEEEIRIREMFAMSGFELCFNGE